MRASGTILREWLEMSAGQFNRIDPAVTTPQPLINPAFPTYNYDVIDGVTYRIDVTQPARATRRRGGSPMHRRGESSI